MRKLYQKKSSNDLLFSNQRYFKWCFPLPKLPTLILILGLFSFNGFGQSCPNNVSSPSGCPTAAVGEIDVSMGVPPIFCVNPSDAGCGTIRFINIPSAAQHGCPVELCFKPSQGCGVAGTNLCLYESDGSGGCNFLQVGSSATGICVSPTSSTYEITICRPGNGPVSAQDISINSCCAADTDPPSVTCADFTETFDGCPAGLGPNTPNGVWFPIGPAGGFIAASGGIYSMFLDLSTCVTDNFSALANIEITLFSSYEENRTACAVTLVNEFSVRDECENISPDRIITRFTIQDLPGTPPTIVCPADITLECDESTVPIIDGGTLPSATATDDCDPNPMIAYSDTFTPGNCPQNRVIERTWTAIDACGVTSSCIQTITVQDTEGPVVTCADFTATYDGCPGPLGPNTPNGAWIAVGPDGGFTAASGGSFTVPVDLTSCVVDNCGLLENLEYTLHSSYVENRTSCAVTLVNEFSVRDECGNVAADRVITKITIQDVEAPVVTCAPFTATFDDCPGPLGPNTPSGNWISIPASGIFQVASGGSYIITVDLNGCVSDNCTDLEDMEWTLHSSYEENRTSCAVTLVNELSIRDECGLISPDRVITKITIQDVEAPVVTCADFTETYTGCPAGLGPNTPNGNWFAVGPDGGFTAASGGSYSIPVDLTSCVSDNCTDLEDIEVTLHSSYEENRTSCQVTLVNEFSVRDECGLISPDRIITKITIVDDEAPVVTCADFTETFTGCSAGLGPNTPNGNWFAVGPDGGFTAASGGSFSIPVDLTSCVSDNCTDLEDIEVTLHSSYEENRTDCQVTLVNEFSVRDECGTIAADRIITRITIVDDEAPVVTCADFTATFDGCPAPLGPNTPNGVWFPVGTDGGFTAASGGSYTIPVDLTSCVSDNCSDLANIEVTLHSSYEENRTACQVTLVNEFSVRDECENVAADRIITRITIQDMSPIPVITCPTLPAIECVDVASYVPPMAPYSGACLSGMVSGTVTSTPDPLSCGGTLEVTYTGVDDCGRTLVPVTCFVTVNPAPAPTLASILFVNPITCEEAAAFVAPDLPYSNNLPGDCNISGTIPPAVQNNWDACGGEIIINYNGADLCGNMLSAGPFTITVEPAPAPTLTPPTFPTSISCEAGVAFVAPPATYTNGLLGVCNISGAVPPIVVTNFDACGGTITVTYDDLDECDNPLMAGPFVINVEAAPLPVISIPPYSSPMSCTAAANFVPSDATYSNGLTGICNISGIIPAAFDNNFDACGGNITVYYFGVDDCGRAISVPPIVLAVQPAPMPTITLPALPTSVSCADAASYVPPTATYDNGLPGVCNISGNADHTINYDYDGCGGVLQVIYLAEDPCGRNLVKTSALITVDPAPAPTINVPAYPADLSCGEAEALVGIVATYSNGLDDDCLIEGFISPSVVKNVDACSGGEVIITYSGMDDCGNFISAPSIVIPVSPATLPTVHLSDDPLMMYCWEANGFVPSPATFSNGENGFCENSGELTLTTFDNSYWNNCDGGYILLQFMGEDNCGNALQTDLYKIAVMPDTWGPQGECSPIVETIEDIKNTPTPADLDFYKYMIASNYSDYCGDVIVTIVGDTGTPVCGLDGTFSRVYDVEITDECGNVAGNCSITFEGNCNPLYCTLSEDFYSTPDDQFGGFTSQGMINELIDFGANPIKVGAGDCGINLDDANCIQTALAGEGQSISLASGFDFTCGSPINNNLINQIITTTLNIRYNAQLNGSGLDYGNFQINAACIYCPAFIKDALPDNATVNDLLDYANAFIGCQCTGECGNYDASGVEADITNILLGLNSRFNECYVPGPCFLDNETETTEPETSGTLFPTFGGTNAEVGNDSDLLDVVISPNPAVDILNVEIKDVEGQSGTIDIFDAKGRKIATQSYTSLGQDLLQFDVKKLPMGMYWISIQVDGFEQVTKRFIVKK